MTYITSAVLLPEHLIHNYFLLFYFTNLDKIKKFNASLIYYLLLYFLDKFLYNLYLRLSTSFYFMHLFKFLWLVDHF